MAIVVVGATVVVVVVGAVVLVLVVLVLVVDVDASAEPTVSASIVVEVASGVVGDGASAGSAVLVTATDDAPMPSAESERPPLQPAPAANATTSRMAAVRTNRT